MATERIPLTAETIIQTAADLLDSHGADKLTLTLIANTIGVTQPALYNHVNGMDQVWRGLGLRERSILVAKLANATVGLSGDDAVRAVARSWREFAREHTALYATADRYAVEGDSELEAAVGDVITIIVATLRGFDLTEDQRLHAAVALRSSLHGFCTFELGHGNPTPLAMDDMFTHIVELFLVGLRALAKGTIDELEEKDNQ